MSGRRRDHLLLCYWLQRQHWKSRLLNLKQRQKTWKPEKLRMRTTWLASGTDSGKDIRSVITIALADKSQQLLWRCWIDPTKGITKKGERNGVQRTPRWDGQSCIMMQVRMPCAGHGHHDAWSNDPTLKSRHLPPLLMYRSLIVVHWLNFLRLLLGYRLVPSVFLQVLLDHDGEPTQFMSRVSMWRLGLRHG